MILAHAHTIDQSVQLFDVKALAGPLLLIYKLADPEEHCPVRLGTAAPVVYVPSHASQSASLQVISCPVVCACRRTSAEHALGCITFTRPHIALCMTGLSDAYICKLAHHLHSIQARCTWYKCHLIILGAAATLLLALLHLRNILHAVLSSAVHTIQRYVMAF